MTVLLRTRMKITITKCKSYYNSYSSNEQLW